MKALVTGAGGFVGRQLTRRLHEAHWSIATLGLRPATRDRHTVLAGCDDLAGLRGAIEHEAPDVVFHLAGVARVADWGEFYRINTLFGVNLLEAIAKTKRQGTRVIVVGSAAEYGAVPPDEDVREDFPAAPESAYGISKLALSRHALTVARAAGVECVIVRPFNIVGVDMPPHLVLPSWIAQLRAMRSGTDRVLRVGNTRTIRDFAQVDDVVDAMLALATSPQAAGQIFNLCSGQPARIDNLLARLVALAGEDVSVVEDAALFRASDPVRVVGSAAKLAAAGLRVPRGLDDALLRRMFETQPSPTH